MRCRYCGQRCVKDGLQADGSQRYKCKHCHKRQQSRYRYNAYAKSTDSQIIALTKIGVGVRNIAKYIRISTTTVLVRIRKIAKNLLKLYLNDVGILSGIYYRNNIKAVMSDIRIRNLGPLYETVVAQELKTHGYNLYYCDNKKNGEVDYLIDDTDNLSNIPIEVKSGKEYTIHSALSRFLSDEDYNIKHSFVFSNECDVYTKDGVTYIPIYYVIFPE